MILPHYYSIDHLVRGKKLTVLSCKGYKAGPELWEPVELHHFSCLLRISIFKKAKHYTYLQLFFENITSQKIKRLTKKIVTSHLIGS